MRWRVPASSRRISSWKADPEGERQRMESWFYGEHFPKLMEWDHRHVKNLVRAHTSFPVSFSIAARKPAR
jgi:hypothetical protein